MSAKWIKNESEEGFGEITVGDIVHLKFEDSFSYLAKCVVQEINEAKITAFVDEVFDWHTKGVIGNTLTGTIEQIRGNTVTFEKGYIHSLIKTNKKA